MLRIIFFSFILFSFPTFSILPADLHQAITLELKDVDVTDEKAELITQIVNLAYPEECQAQTSLNLRELVHLYASLDGEVLMKVKGLLEGICADAKVNLVTLTQMFACILNPQLVAEFEFDDLAFLDQDVFTKIFGDRSLDERATWIMTYHWPFQDQAKRYEDMPAVMYALMRLDGDVQILRRISNILTNSSVIFNAIAVADDARKIAELTLAHYEKLSDHDTHLQVSGLEDEMFSASAEFPAYVRDPFYWLSFMALAEGEVDDIEVTYARIKKIAENSHQQLDQDIVDVFVYKVAHQHLEEALTKAEGVVESRKVSRGGNWHFENVEEVEQLMQTYIAREENSNGEEGEPLLSLCLRFGSALSTVIYGRDEE